MSARGSHAPSLLRRVERLVRDEALFSKGDLVVVACSGGPDSTALLHALALLRPRLGHQLAACGVDHGLRPEAPAELALAAQVAAGLGVPFQTLSVDVPPGPNVQARARDARLRALGQAARSLGGSRVATGHTADDRAETVILRLLRGAGPRGLGVLPPSAPSPVDPAITLARPLLGARRADVLAHLDRHGLPSATDPSNADPRFTRARVRAEVMPLLEDLSPGVVTHLCALADMLLEGDERADHAENAALEGLGRAQRLEIRKARRLGRPSVRLRVEKGREVLVTFSEGGIILNEKPRG